MNQYWKGQPIQCATYHPKSFRLVELEPFGIANSVYMFDAMTIDNKLVGSTFQTFEGNELLQSILTLWSHLDVSKQIEKSGAFKPYLYEEDDCEIRNWLAKYGSPYIEINLDDTGELHVPDDEHAYFRIFKFINDLYNFMQTYMKIQKHETSYSQWPVFFHTDGNMLILRTANLISVAYIQMIFAALPGNDKIKLCENCGGLFVAQRRNARLCENCFLHRSTTWYRENKGRNKL